MRPIILVKLLIDKMKTTDAFFGADKCILAGLLRRNLRVGKYRRVPVPFRRRLPPFSLARGACSREDASARKPKQASAMEEALIRMRKSLR
jgi:hypothetical protein